jgi:hypothetical protein
MKRTLGKKDVKNILLGLNTIKNQYKEQLYNGQIEIWRDQELIDSYKQKIESLIETIEKVQNLSE